MLLALAAKTAGIDFPELCEEILKNGVVGRGLAPAVSMAMLLSRVSARWAVFFAEPLVSELPDGFRLKCELVALTRLVVSTRRQNKTGVRCTP